MAAGQGKWQLLFAARCAQVQEHLTPEEQRSVEELSQPLVPVTAHASSSSSGPEDQLITSAHLERWKKWKLEDKKLEELTAEPATLDLVRPHVDDLAFFARGKRGVLYAGTLKRSSQRVVVKLDASTNLSTTSVVDQEAQWLQRVNRMGIGPALHSYGPGWLAMEQLQGRHIIDFLSANETTMETARWAVQEMLCQCYTLDSMGINKEEMTHPMRHIIIHTRNRAQNEETTGNRPRLKCTFIDFEKCTQSKKPKNVTQLCQFLSSPRVVDLLRQKEMQVNISKLRLCAKKYKQNASSTAFNELLRIFGL